MFVVTLPRTAEKDPRAYALRAESLGADILELRGDITPNLTNFESPLPLLLSPRGAGEEFLNRFQAEYVDFEVREIESGMQCPATAHLILSYHDYERTPPIETIKKIVQKMCSLNPWMIKIATQINAYSDFLIHEETRKILNKKIEQSTVLGMGEKSHLSRALSPYKNTFTYACSTREDASAPGQMTLQEYARQKHVRTPIVAGVLGGSLVTASLSPLIHSHAAAKKKVDYLYSCFPAEDLADAISSLTQCGVSCFSVTAPWKREILKYVTMIDPLVSRLGSANTVLFRGSESIAYNTDVVGFAEGYPFLAEAKHVAILGSGGVVPAIVDALRSLSPSVGISIYARNPEAAHALWKCDAEVLSLSEALKAKVDTVISAVTEDVALPVPPIASSRSRESFHAIDLRYARKTLFLSDAESKGYQLHDGLPMLLAQAFAQFELFTGVELSLSDRMELSSTIRADLS